jgi:hypothetical protein
MTTCHYCGIAVSASEGVAGNHLPYCFPCVGRLAEVHDQIYDMWKQDPQGLSWTDYYCAYKLRLNGAFAPAASEAKNKVGIS